MKTSQEGINLVKHFEGFKAKPYLCPAKIPTIGYGATFYKDGKKVTLQDFQLLLFWAVLYFN